MTRALVVLAALACGCRSAAPKCPDSPAAAQPPSAPAPPAPPPSEPAAAAPDSASTPAETPPSAYDPVDLRWGTVDARDLAPRELGDLQVSVAPTERGGTEDAPELWLRVTVADGDGAFATIERQVDTRNCGSDLQPDVEAIHTEDPAALVFHASLQCNRGSSTRHITTAHVVVSVDALARTATVLAFESGGGHFNDYRADLVKIRFLTEGNSLGIYEETVRWCDRQTQRERLDIDDPRCKLRPRKLRLVRRIRLY